MQEDLVFKCRAIIAYTAGSGLASSTLAQACSLAHAYTHTHSRPRAQLFVGVATLHKRKSFIRCIQPFHLLLYAHALINQILRYYSSTHVYAGLGCMQSICISISLKLHTHSVAHTMYMYAPGCICGLLCYLH